jgi:hypothetical protein
MTAVLFTCAGQRVDIVSAFGRAGATTVASDLDPLAPALYHAHHRAIVPRVDDPGYIAALQDLVALHDVRLIEVEQAPRLVSIGTALGAHQRVRRPGESRVREPQA